MHSMFFILFYFAIVVGINSAWVEQPVSINQDAVELARLAQQFWSLTPAIMKRAEPLVYCQIIDHCCSDEDRTEAVSIIGRSIFGTDKGRFEQIMEKCMNSTSSNKGNQLCSSIVQSIIPSHIFDTHPDMEKYFNIIDQHNNAINTVFSPMISVCKSEEIHSVVCSSKMTLVESCMSKALRNVFDDNFYDYQQNVLDAKETFTAMNQQLSKAFI